MAEVPGAPKSGQHAKGGLPPELRQFFWDVDFARLSWIRDRDFVIGRLMDRGDLRAIRRLRRTVGDGNLRIWLEVRSGDGLSPRRLRYWELVLGLPHSRVSRWIEAQRSQPWTRRLTA